MQSSEEIPVGKPIVPPYNGSKVFPVARLLHAGKTTGVSPDAEEEEESSDTLLEEIRALPLILNVIMASNLRMICS